VGHDPWQRVGSKDEVLGRGGGEKAMPRQVYKW